MAKAKITRIKANDSKKTEKTAEEPVITRKKVVLKDKKVDINLSDSDGIIEIEKDSGYKSSIKIGGMANPGDFLSEYQKKFIRKFNLNDNIKDKKLMETIANIRRSHFKFGDNKNDYLTTHDESYKYNPKLAEAGRGKLNSELRNNLMSSHYQIGAGNDMEKMTSNRRDYRGYPGYIRNKSVQPDNSSNIFKGTKNIFEGETIYMSDFTEKPLPDPDENVPNFL